MQYGYQRVQPIHGADYILDMILLFKKFRGRKTTVTVRRHAYVQQGFALPQSISDEQWRARQTGHQLSDIRYTRIHMILPLSGRAQTFIRFVDNFRTVCADQKEQPVSLVVVLFRSDSQQDAVILQTLDELSARYAAGTVRLVDLGPVAFSRAVALTRGSDSLADPQSLLFFTDVDVLFTGDALYRIRRNTVAGAQVFYPIVFSEYAPETWDAAEEDSHPLVFSERFRYGRTRGYFRHFGFGLVSMYKQDLESVGGLDTSIKGWGKEDVDLFEKCLRHSSLTIMRVPEVGLVHGYHPVKCDSTALPPAQYKMCLGSRSASYGSVDSLADHFRALATGA